MTKDDILKSEVFKALNLLIDQSIKDVETYGMMLLDGATLRKDGGRRVQGRIDNRIHEEGDTYVEVPIDPRKALDMVGDIREIDVASRMVQRIQRFKLELLNDYDFTHGDATTQEAVFGKVDE